MSKLGYCLIWNANISGTYRVEPQKKFFDDIRARLGGVTPYRNEPHKAFYINEKQLRILRKITSLKWMGNDPRQRTLY